MISWAGLFCGVNRLFFQKMIPGQLVNLDSHEGGAILDLG